MAKKLALSYGHGANTFNDLRSKAVIVGGKVYEEHTHNAVVGDRVRKIVEAHGISVLVVQPPMGKDVPLRTRTDRANAWGADLYYSIHANADDPLTKGYAAFYWSTSGGGKAVAEDYAKNAKAAGFPLYHNGIYPSIKGTWNDFHELRETEMPAVLTENGFMTNKEDFKRIFLDKVAQEKEAIVHAKTILEFFKVTYDPKKAGESDPSEKAGTTDIYRVIVDGRQVGAYAADDNILDQAKKALAKKAKKITMERV